MQLPQHARAYLFRLQRYPRGIADPLAACTLHTQAPALMFGLCIELRAHTLSYRGGAGGQAMYAWWGLGPARPRHPRQTPLPTPHMPGRGRHAAVGSAPQSYTVSVLGI